METMQNYLNYRQVIIIKAKMYLKKELMFNVKSWNCRFRNDSKETY